jgi:hypothetical protein
MNSRMSRQDRNRTITHQSNDRKLLRAGDRISLT